MIEAGARVKRRWSADFVEKAGKPVKSSGMLVLGVRGPGQMLVQSVALACATFAWQGAILRDKYREISLLIQIKTEKSSDLRQRFAENFP
jgi:hypothetical protein